MVNVNVKSTLSSSVMFILFGRNLCGDFQKKRKSDDLFAYKLGLKCQYSTNIDDNNDEISITAECDMVE